MDDEDRDDRRAIEYDNDNVKNSKTVEERFCQKFINGF